MLLDHCYDCRTTVMHACNFNLCMDLHMLHLSYIGGFFVYVCYGKNQQIGWNL